MTHDIETDGEEATDDDHYYDNMAGENGGAPSPGVSSGAPGAGGCSAVAQGSGSAGSIASAASSGLTAAPVTYELPTCELSKLSVICDMFNSALLVPMRRDNLSSAIESAGYIRKLTELFHTCEDLGDNDGLRYLYDIFKVSRQLRF